MEVYIILVGILDILGGGGRKICVKKNGNSGKEKGSYVKSTARWGYGYLLDFTLYTLNIQTIKHLRCYD